MAGPTVAERSRRAVLAGMVGGAAAVVAGALGRPTPAWAAQTPMLTEYPNTAESQTSISSKQAAGSSAVFAAYATEPASRVYALFGQTASATGYGVFGYTEAGGIGVQGRSTTGTGVIGIAGSDDLAPVSGAGVVGQGESVGVMGSGPIGVQGGTNAEKGTGVYAEAWGKDAYGFRSKASGSGAIGIKVDASGPGVLAYSTGNVGGSFMSVNATGVIAKGGGGSGVIGVSAEGNPAIPTPSNVGVFGWSAKTGGAGIAGQADAGIGVAASSTNGVALKVTGKTRLSRSGRKDVPAGKSYVDVDLSTLGGLSSTSLCFANLAYPRTGVWIRAVQPNYPSTGKMRIYLNKVASDTRQTPLSWLVLEGA